MFPAINFDHDQYETITEGLLGKRKPVTDGLGQDNYVLSTPRQSITKSKDYMLIKTDKKVAHSF